MPTPDPANDAVHADRPAPPLPARSGADGLARYRDARWRDPGAAEAHDAVLERQVAVQPAGGDEVAFQERARLLASLDFPGIPAVYDLDRTDDGRLCCLSRPTWGRTLAEAIRSPRGVTTPRQWMPVMRRVGEALAHAHACGVLHLDVRPEHILLQPHGTILLLGWDSARRVGTAGALPASLVYAAPELPRGEEVGVAADIYAYAATLFHLVVGRTHRSAIDEETFSLRARDGDIDQPTEAEAARVPQPLLAIIMHALSAEPAGRYHTMAAMLRDIDAFLEGAPVSVMQHAQPGRLRAWYRRHAIAVWAFSALILGLVASGWFLYGDHLSQLSSWGRPIRSYAFDTAATAVDGMQIVDGGFVQQHGVLISTGENASCMMLTKRLEGPVAVEYRARVQPGAVPGDLSVVYSLDPPSSVVAASKARRYYLQIGARENSYAQILDPDRRSVAFHPLRLETGRTYRVRMEIEGEAMRVHLDGRLICEHREVVPIDSGWLGLYAYYPGKEFDDLRIYNQGMPETVTPLVVGEQYCRDGSWDSAAASFARIAEVHRGKPLGDEAAFRAGVALQQAGRAAEAEEMWKPLAGGRWSGRIAIAGLETQLATRKLRPTDLGLLKDADRSGALRSGGIYALIAARISSLYPMADAELRQRLETLWSAAVFQAGGPDVADPSAIDDLVLIRDRHFPGRCGSAAAAALLALRRYDELLNRYPEHVIPAAEALLRLGRAAEVAQRWPEARFQIAAALLDMGRVEDLRAMQPPVHSYLNRIRDDFQVDLTRFTPSSAERDIAEEQTRGILPMRIMDAACMLDRPLLAVRASEKLKDPQPEPLLTASYLLADADEALLRRFPHWLAGRTIVDYHRVFTDGYMGRPLQPAVRDPGTDWYRTESLWLAHLLLAPYVAEWSGGRGAIDRGLETILSQHRWHFMQRPWFCASYILGRIDEAAFLAQPYAGNADPLLNLCKGLKAEHDGDKPAAKAAYDTFLQRTPNLRCLHTCWRDGLAERFVEWRARALAAPRD